MADEDVVMFRFENNIAENAAEIAAGLTETIQMIHNAARKAGGTAVPVTFGDDLVQHAQRSANQAAEILQKVLDPRKLSGKASPADVRGEMSKVAVGAFQNIQRDIDKQVAQLGPEAQKALSASGALGKVMDHVAHALVAEVMASYEHLRASFDGELKQRLPTVGKLGKINEHLGRQVGQQEYYLQPAAEQRASKLFTADEDGMEETNAAAYAAAEVAAEAARVKAAAAKTKQELAKAQRELSEALADMVGREDPIAVAMGLRRNPETGKPARRKGEGWEDITDPRQVTEMTAKYLELKDAVSSTRAMMGESAFRLFQEGDKKAPTAGGFGQVRPIGKSSRFFVKDANEEEGEEAQLYEAVTKHGIQYLQLLNGTQTKLKSLSDATRMYNKERAQPIEAAQADAARKSQAAAKEAAAAEKKAAEEKVRQAKAVADEEERAAREAARRQANDAKRVRGFIPGLIQGGLGSGFNATGALEPGLITANIGKTIGTAARYTLAYGGFYQFLQAMKSGVSIFADYQDSFTDFQVAMGEGSQVTQTMTNDLMGLSVALGENVGAAYDAAARGVRAFASDASAADKNAAGLATASAAMKIAVIGNKTIGDATGDAVSIGLAYGLNAQQTDQLVPDWLANAKRNIGGDPTQLSQGLSNFAGAATSAGFSGQEAANAIALIQSKTDESGQAVSTRLTRILQIASGSTGKSLAGDVNRALGHSAVDITATPKKMLEDFARAYVEAGKKGLTGLQGQIRSQLGGTSNLKELLPLLEGGGQERLAKALKDALPGAGMSEFQRKTQTVMGQLKQVQGYVQNLTVLAANADIFAPFAIGVKVLTPTLHLLQSILQVYEKLEGSLGSIGGPVLSTVGEAGLGYLAFQKIRKTALAQEIAGTSGVTGAVVRSAGVAPIAGEGAEAAAAARNAQVTNVSTAAKAREAEAANLLSAAELRAAEATNLYAATTARLNLLGVAAGTEMAALRGNLGKFKVALGVGAILAAGILVDQTAKAHKGLDSAKGTELNYWSSLGKVDPATGKITVDPQKMQNDADAMRSLGPSTKKSVSILNDIDSVFSPGKWRSTFADRTKAEADLMDHMTKAAFAEKRRTDALRTNLTFGDAGSRTTDSINEVFDQLTASGRSAHQSLSTYFHDLMTPPAERLSSGETPNMTTAAVMTAIGMGAKTSINHMLKDGLYKGGAAGSKLAGITHWVPSGWKANRGDLADALELDKQMPAMQQAILKGIAKAGPNMDKMDLTAIASGAINGLNLDKARASIGGFDADKFRADMLGSVKKRVAVLQHQFSVLGPMSPAELAGLFKGQDAAMAAVDPTDPTATARQARENYLEVILRRNAEGTRNSQIKKLRDLYDNKLHEPGRNPLRGGLDRLTDGRIRDNAMNTLLRKFGLEDYAVTTRRHEWRQAQMAESEDARAVAESRVPDGDSSQLAKVRLKFAKVTFRQAGADVSLIEGLMESLDKQTVKGLLKFQEERVRIAQITYDKEQKLLDEANAILGGSISGHPGSGQTRDKPDVSTKARDEAKKRLDREKQRLKGDKIAYGRAAITSDNPDGTSDADKLSAAQEAALRAQAMTSPRNSLAQARVGLQVARADLDKIKNHHSREYYSALQAVTTAESTLAGALSDRATAAANLAAARAGGGALATAKAQIQAGINQLKLKGNGPAERDNALASIASGHLAERQAEAGKVGAIAQANAARIGGGIANARAGLAGAAAMLRVQARGTLEWWQQYGNYVQAQQAVRDAALAYRNNLDLLRGDSTDPVEQARDALRAAARKLRQDRRRGAGKDVIAEDKVAVDNANNQYAASKFDQRFSDMQTAEDMGRMSFAKWMSYLDHEHERLSRIKHRTRQQQDQLDQVDKAMKDALNSMDSQFNLGDINTKGLVYQVRRFKAEASAQLPSAATNNTTHQTVSISISGADTAKVKTIIDGYLRIGGGQRQALTRRKV